MCIKARYRGENCSVKFSKMLSFILITCELMFICSYQSAGKSVVVNSVSADWHSLFLHESSFQIKIIDCFNFILGTTFPSILGLGTKIWNRDDHILSNNTDFLQISVACDAWKLY